jgi:molybdenum cofactor biosynthesis enzyme MoaA
MMATIRPTVKFLITARCNIRCRFCHNEFQGDGDGACPTIFDANKTIALLRSISEDGIFSDLKLSGGEPLTFVEGLKAALAISENFEFKKKILVTNLLAGNSTVFSILKDNGVTEFRVNVPAFVPEMYQSLTGTTRKAYSVLLNRLELARKFGFYLRANTVICDGSLDSLRHQLMVDAPQPNLWDLFDEVFLIADYRSTHKTLLERELCQLVEAAYGSIVKTRKSRISEYRSSNNKKISIARCTVTDPGGEGSDGRDFYIRPPGELMTRFVPGFAFKHNEH